MRVLKFGGTSVVDAAAIARVVSIVAGREGPRTVVVSALAGVADGLLWVGDAGVAAQWIDARHVVRTDGRHRAAVPDLAATDKAVTRLVRPALALDRVVVLGGFIGSGPNGATTTLGRGGSDYSAALVGACLL